MDIKGPLHTEYLWYLPHTYIYYAAGRVARGRTGTTDSRGEATNCRSESTSGRLLLLSVVHAHVVAPALCGLAVAAFRDGVDHRVVKGALVSSVGGPCAWLSLSLGQQHAASLLAVNYLSSLLAEPLTMLLICGRATIPPLGGIVTTLVSTIPPFGLGALRPQTHNSCAIKLSALVLLYVDCCGRLTEAEGGLYVGDVLIILMLEASYVCASAAWCALYGPHAHALRAAALPKALTHGWQSWGACSARWSPLPAVFLAPAQALVLAALGGGDRSTGFT